MDDVDKFKMLDTRIKLFIYQFTINFMVHELSPIRIYAYDMRHIPNMITDGKISPNTFISIYIIESNTSKSVNFKRHSFIQLICSNITAKIHFRSNSTKRLNVRKLKECFVQYFFAVPPRLFWGPRGHLGSCVIQLLSLELGLKGKILEINPNHTSAKFLIS